MWLIFICIHFTHILIFLLYNIILWSCSKAELVSEKVEFTETKLPFFSLGSNFDFGVKSPHLKQSFETEIRTVIVSLNHRFLYKILIGEYPSCLISTILLIFTQNETPKREILSFLAKK